MYIINLNVNSCDNNYDMVNITSIKFLKKKNECKKYVLTSV